MLNNFSILTYRLSENSSQAVSINLMILSKYFDHNGRYLTENEVEIWTEYSKRTLAL